MSMKRILRAFCLTGLLLTMTACNAQGGSVIDNESQGSAENSRTVVRIGSNRAIGTVTPYVAKEMGYFDNENYDVDVIEFGDGSTMMEAMAAGELDMAICGISPVATWQAKGTDIKVVASANGGGHVILSRSSSGIATAADLKGKTMTVPNIGTVTDTILKSYIMPMYGLSDDDITAVPGVKGADMVTMLETTGEVDAIMTWEPYASAGELNYADIPGVFDVAKEWQKDTGNKNLYPVNVICATGDMCNNEPDTVRNLLKVIKKTVDYIQNNPTEAHKVMAEVLGLDVAVVDKASERSQITFDVDVDATLGTLKWAYEAGFLEQMPDPDVLFDLSFMP